MSGLEICVVLVCVWEDHGVVSSVPGLHRSHVSAALKADYFGLKNIKPDKLPPASLGIVFEVPQLSLQIDLACVSRRVAVRANSPPDIRDSCESHKSSDVYGFRPEYNTCIGFLMLVTLAPWTHTWPRGHHYKCVRFAGSAQKHKELCPWRKRQPYLRKKKKHHHNKHGVQRQQQLQQQHNNQKQQQEPKSQRQQQIAGISARRDPSSRFEANDLLSDKRHGDEKA